MKAAAQHNFARRRKAMPGQAQHGGVRPSRAMCGTVLLSIAVQGAAGQSAAMQGGNAIAQKDRNFLAR